jgi:hypothetical protein
MKSKKEAKKHIFCQSEAQQESPSTCLQPDQSHPKHKIEDLKSSIEYSPADKGDKKCCSARNANEIQAEKFQVDLNQLIGRFWSVTTPHSNPLLPVTEDFVTFSTNILAFSKNLVANLGLNSETSSIPSSQNGLANPITKPHIPEPDGKNTKKSKVDNLGTAGLPVNRLIPTMPIKSIRMTLKRGLDSASVAERL